MRRGILPRGCQPLCGVAVCTLALRQQLDVLLDALRVSAQFDTRRLDTAIQFVGDRNQLRIGGVGFAQLRGARQHVGPFLALAGFDRLQQRLVVCLFEQRFAGRQRQVRFGDQHVMVEVFPE